MDDSSVPWTRHLSTAVSAFSGYDLSEDLSAMSELAVNAFLSILGCVCREETLL